MLSPVAIASLRVAIDTLRINPLRTILSTLGVIMGVAALVAVLSLGDGVEHYARKQIERTTDLQTISISPQTFRMVDGQPFPNTDVPSFAEADVAGLRAAVGHGAEVTMLTMGSALVRTRRDTAAHAAQVIGASAGIQTLRGLEVKHGRFYTEDEARRGAPVVVLSNALAAALVRPQPPAARGGGGAARPRMRLAASSTPAPPEAVRLIGDTLTFQGSPRVVVGILAPAELELGRQSYMPVQAAAGASAAGFLARPPSLLVKLGRVEDVAPARQRVEGWLTRRLGEWQGRVDVGTNRVRVEQIEKGMLIFKLLMGAITGISLLVGGIGIMNVLLASVVERTREIGIRKATGAEQRHILLQFLCESVTISSLGSVIGVVFGLVASFGVTALMRRMADAPVYAWVSVSTVMVAVLAAVLVGLTFGLYPALRAARLSPIEAMHHE